MLFRPTIDMNIISIICAIKFYYVYSRLYKIYNAHYYYISKRSYMKILCHTTYI